MVPKSFYEASVAGDPQSGVALEHVCSYELLRRFSLVIIEEAGTGPPLATIGIIIGGLGFKVKEMLESLLRTVSLRGNIPSLRV